MSPLSLFSQELRCEVAAITATGRSTEFSGQRRQSSGLILRPAVFDREMLSFDVSNFRQAIMEAPSGWTPCRPGTLYRGTRPPASPTAARARQAATRQELVAPPKMACNKISPSHRRPCPTFNEIPVQPMAPCEGAGLLPLDVVEAAKAAPPRVLTPIASTNSTMRMAYICDMIEIGVGLDHHKTDAASGDFGFRQQCRSNQRDPKARAAGRWRPDGAWPADKLFNAICHGLARKLCPTLIRT